LLFGLCATIAKAQSPKSKTASVTATGLEFSRSENSRAE
jgi:hypothetical protein